MGLGRFTNCLWFDSNAEEAAAFYTSIFPNSKVGDTYRYSEVGKEHHGKEAGSVVTVEFELDGHSFVGLNGGPIFKFSPAISFQVDCKDQAEVDYYWEKLGDGGDTSIPCGWLTDKFGVSWQIIPSEFVNLQREATPKQMDEMMKEMFKMKKLDVAVFKAAFDSAK